MPKRATPLTAQKVAKAKPGRYFDGDGLVLLVREASTFAPDGKIKQYGRAWWLYRYTLRGRTRDLGIGRAIGHNSVSLADARIAAARARAVVKSGTDPLAERQAEEARKAAAAALAAAKAITFKTCAGKYITANKAGWKNAKHGDQWENTLATYVYPTIGELAVSEIDTGHVTRVLEPIWTAKPETASRVRGRIESVLSYATTHNWRAGENPARWRGHLENVLPKKSKVAKVVHHAALPWRDTGAFMKALAAQHGTGALAFRFAILTATRTGEIIGAKWSEIDMQHAVWTIPGERMKAGVEHRVPLSANALALLREAEKLRADGVDFVFPGGRKGKPLSNMSFLMLLRRMAREDITAHGFRSTFRDWAAETGQPADIAEAALAHTVGDKTVAAYQRGDLLDRRRKLMEDWAKFCDKPMPAPGANVTLIRAVG